MCWDNTNCKFYRIIQIGLIVYSDLYPCIITPAGVIYAAPTVRTQMKSHLMAIWNWITEWKQRLFRENIVTAF